jgi:two-component system LytT family response regulator
VIKVLLVDDEIAALEMIKTLMLPFRDELEIVASCQSVGDAITNMERCEADLLLLDIELGEGLSFEILEHFPDMAAHVIFITAYDHYALKAIKYHAFDYLLKPIIAAELHMALTKAISDIRNRRRAQPSTQALLDYLKGSIRQKIAVPGRNGLNYFNLDDIVSVEADGSYVTMYLSNTAKVLVSKSLKDFETSLTGKGFLRVHKSYLVNIQHIASLNRDAGGYLVMTNAQRIPISPKDKDMIITNIKQLSNII